MGSVNSSKNVHINAALTNFSIAYRNGMFVADMVAPVLKVAKESDKYYVWDASNGFRLPSARRADGSAANQVEMTLSENAYSAEEFALKVKITDRQKNNADSVLRLKQSKTGFLKDLIQLEREKRVATLLTTQGNYATGHYDTLSGANRWNDPSFSGSIEETIDTGKEAVRSKIGMEPNTIIIPAAVAKVMKRNATLRELIKYTQNNLLVNGDLPPTLFNMRVVIPGSTNITSKEGASTTTYADVWGKNIVMLWLPETAEMDSPCAVKTFRSRDWLVKEWRDEELSSDFVENGMIEDVKMTSNVSAYLLKTVIN